MKIFHVMCVVEGTTKHLYYYVTNATLAITLIVCIHRCLRYPKATGDAQNVWLKYAKILLIYTDSSNRLENTHLLNSVKWLISLNRIILISHHMWVKWIGRIILILFSPFNVSKVNTVWGGRERILENIINTEWFTFSKIWSWSAYFRCWKWFRV